MHHSDGTKDSTYIDMGKAHLLQLETPADDAPAMIVHTSVGDITAVLYPEVAPIMWAQFTELVEKGYYDGTYVYQTEPGVYFRAGSPNADGTLDDQLDESRQKVETETSSDLWPFRGAFCAPVTEKDNNFFKMLFGNDVSYCGTRFLVCNTIEFDEETKTELADTDESAAAVTDTFLSWGGIPNYAQQMTIFAQAYGKESFSVIDTITGAATPSENGTTATTVSTAKSDAPIQIETITLHHLGRNGAGCLCTGKQHFLMCETSGLFSKNYLFCEKYTNPEKNISFFCTVL